MAHPPAPTAVPSPEAATSPDHMPPEPASPAAPPPPAAPAAAATVARTPTAEAPSPQPVAPDAAPPAALPDTGASPPPGTPGGWVFLADRQDGFGCRMGALLNAMALAHATGGEFRFAWSVMRGAESRHHDILPADETFAPEFLARHRLVASRAARPRIRPLPPFAQALAAGAPMPPGCDLMRVDFKPLPALPGLGTAEEWRTAAARDFAGLPFAPALDAARSAAAQAPLAAGAIALHLRAGDIIYGRYRHGGFLNGRACPFVVAEVIAERARRAKRPLVIFGQDLALCAYMRDRHGAVLAADLAAERGLTGAAHAMFDICLMARCAVIQAGASGFSWLATRIGQARQEPFHRGLPPEHAIAAFDRARQATDLDPRISDLQRAYAAWWGLSTYGGLLQAPAAIAFADHGMALDPANLLFPLSKAARLYGAEQRDAA